MRVRESRLKGILAAAVLLFASVGCEATPPRGSPSTCRDSALLPPSVSTDILFVIDDSRSMSAAQRKVVEQMEAFIETLASSSLHNDFQIGVITTSVSLSARGCDPESPPMFASYPHHQGRLQRGKDLLGQELDPADPKILRFDDPELIASARRLLGQGVVGSGQEMALEAMRLALTEPLISMPLGAQNPGNLGFLRAASRLLVVIVSDEDDCSDPTGTAIALQPPCGEVCQGDEDCPDEGHYCMAGPGEDRRCHANNCETPEGRALLEPVQSYVDFLRSMDDGTGRPRDVFLAVIGAVDPADPLTPSRCGQSEGRGVRYVEAVELMGEHGYIDSICRDDYGQAMVEIAALLDAPQLLELGEEPLDPRLIELRVTRRDGSSLTCALGTDFDYLPPQAGTPARLELLTSCRLRHGDDVVINLLCAG